MAYITSVGDKSYTIDTGENSPQREISIDRLKFDIDWQQIAPLAADAKKLSNVGGQYSLLIEGKSYEILARRINKSDVAEYRYEVLVAGHHFEIAVEHEREKALLGSIHRAHQSGEVMVRAPMPGLVSGLPMAPGSNVERGQTVVILEAMKMENDLASPINGTVKEIMVSKGQTVNQGDVLVVVSAE
jgi:biotin carboxyl carrier protein